MGLLYFFVLIIQIIHGNSPWEPNSRGRDGSYNYTGFRSTWNSSKGWVYSDEKWDRVCDDDTPEDDETMDCEGHWGQYLLPKAVRILLMMLLLLMTLCACAVSWLRSKGCRCKLYFTPCFPSSAPSPSR